MARGAVQTATQRLHRPPRPHPKTQAAVPVPFTGGSLVGGGSVSATFVASGVLVGGAQLTGSVQVVLP